MISVCGKRRPMKLSKIKNEQSAYRFWNDEDKYKGGSGGKKQFCVSTQHYSFVEDFVRRSRMRSERMILTKQFLVRF